MSAEEETRIEKRLMELANELKEMSDVLKMSIHLDVTYNDPADASIYMFPGIGHIVYRGDSYGKPNFLGIIQEAEIAMMEAEEEKDDEL